MKKTVIVTMKVELADLSADELRENAKLGECKVSDLPVLRDFTPSDIAETVVGSLENSDEIFAGSDMHIRLVSARLVEADWATP